MRCLIFSILIGIQMSRLLIDPNELQYRGQELDILRQSECNSISTFQLLDGFDRIMLTGYLKASSNETAYSSFIFYGSKESNFFQEVGSQPTIIYINGGPGASSLLSSFLESGPLIFDELTNQFRRSNTSWNDDYNLLYLDFPAGTGFGHIGNDNVTQNIAGSFELIMQEFYDTCIVKHKMHKLATTNQWFMIAQEYATRYVIEIMSKHLKGEISLWFRVGGIMIGDPFIEPLKVITELPNYAMHLGLIDFQERQYFEKAVMAGMLSHSKGNQETSSNYLQKAIQGIVQRSGGLNRYNIMKFQDIEMLEESLSVYLNSIKDKLLFKTNFIANERRIYETFRARDFMSNKMVQKQKSILFFQIEFQRLEGILKKKVQVLIFQSQFDLMIPCSANMRWIYELHYDFSNEFQMQDFKFWMFQNKIVGYAKNVANLEFRMVLNSGQLVGLDQPEVWLALIKTFIETLREI